MQEITAIQEVITVQDAFIIKWLIGIVCALVVFFNRILVYWIKDIHKMVKEDHELLRALYTEHKIHHKDTTGIGK